MLSGSAFEASAMEEKRQMRREGGSRAGYKCICTSVIGSGAALQGKKCHHVAVSISVRSAASSAGQNPCFPAFYRHENSPSDQPTFPTHHLRKGALFRINQV